jgi:hypothetical protein
MATLSERLAQSDMQGLTIPEIVSVLNSPDSTLPPVSCLKPTRIGPGTIMGTLGVAQGAALLDTLTAMAANSRPIHWALQIIQRGELDLSVEGARAQVDGLAAAGVLTASQAAQLKDLANSSRYPSWSEHHNIPVTAQTVIATRTALPQIWIPKGTTVPRTNYVVVSGGYYQHTALVECGEHAAPDLGVVTYPAIYIVTGH